MSDSFVLVQRNTEGAAVSAEADADKNVKLVHVSPHRSDIRRIDEEQLVDLLSSRQPFDQVAVPPELAERVLGWTIRNDEGDNLS